jgi:KipI family sensor histidine kinase inhibitor
VSVRVVAFGDTALLVEVGGIDEAHRVASSVTEAVREGQAPAGIAEAVVGAGSVVVRLAAHVPVTEEVTAWLSDRAAAACVEGPVAVSGRSDRPHLEIPTAFDGPDLGTVAEQVGGTVDSVVAALVGSDLRVAFLGFAPGFPYLTGLPEDLAAVRRRPTPRVAVPAGAVAVAGGFASVYPEAMPGGWMLVGRTGVTLFDPVRPPYALLRPGDVVRFTAADRGGGAPPGPTPPPARTGHDIEVLHPGMLTLVEDGGRAVGAGIGVPAAGPADPETMGLANRLAGNPNGAAALEVTAAGPSLRFAVDSHVAVVGDGPGVVEVRIDDRPVGDGAVLPVHRGQVVTVGRVRRGLRAYLAVAGGVATPLVVGSRSTDMLSGLGPGPLRAGDWLDVGRPGRPRGRLLPPPGSAAGPGPQVLRILPGPHRSAPVAAALVDSGPWVVGDASNRIGVRLVPRGGGARLPGGEIPSTGMVTGAVQLPPDGHPVILMPDHATLGGYPVVACVIAADLGRAGQLRPGDSVSFVTVDLPAAARAHSAQERVAADRVEGWFPTRAAT